MDIAVKSIVTLYSITRRLITMTGEAMVDIAVTLYHIIQHNPEVVTDYVMNIVC